MNAKERRTVEFVLGIIKKTGNTLEPIRLLEEMLSEDPENKPKKVMLEDGGIESFLYKSDLYPTEESCPFPINAAKGRISSADMYEYYLTHCDAQRTVEMNPKQLKTFLIGLGFTYKNSLSIGGKITTGYILFTDKDVYLSKIVLSKK